MQVSCVLVLLLLLLLLATLRSGVEATAKITNCRVTAGRATGGGVRTMVLVEDAPAVVVGVLCYATYCTFCYVGVPSCPPNVVSWRAGWLPSGLAWLAGYRAD